MHRRLGAARNQIIKTFARADFAHAMMFVDEVATAAEAAGHHPDPDINIRWNQITLALSSHAEGGLTERDFQLGARIPELDRPPAPPDHRLDWTCRGWSGDSCSAWLPGSTVGNPAVGDAITPSEPWPPGCVAPGCGVARSNVPVRPCDVTCRTSGHLLRPAPPDHALFGLG